MRKIHSIFVAMLVGATSLVAQTNYKITFSANVEMDSVQVKNTVSNETRMLYAPNFTISMLKVGKQELPIETITNSAFLQQTTNNNVVVNLEKTSQLNFTLYSSNGSVVARYANNINAGQHTFQIGAPAGVYVLVAVADNLTASIKLLLTQNSQVGIFNVDYENSIAILKSDEEEISYNEDDEFEFTGYYKGQTDIKTMVITENTDISFTFQPGLSVSTIITSFSYTTATIGGSVEADNEATITEKGVCWGTTTNPTINDNKQSIGSGAGSFSTNRGGFVDGVKYYVRAYAITPNGIIYGAEETFTTIKSTEPTVTTNDLTVYTNSIALDGKVESENGANVTARGFCYSTTNTNPTINDSKITVDGGTGFFSYKMSVVTRGITYYVRAYATNSAGTAYGEVKTFYLNTIPTITTTEATNISYTTATVGGNVTADGGATVTERGVCWSTGTTPTISDSKITVGKGTGIFETDITGLDAGTTYYVRAYAKNSAGTAYGTAISFTTEKVYKPSVITVEVTNISYTSATITGKVTADNGAAVTERGIKCASLSAPTIKQTSGTGIGEFTIEFTSLTPGETYYARAYAVNSAGTTNAEPINFTTPVIASSPTVVTTQATYVSISEAIVGGDVTSDNGASVTERGVCWGTSSNPTIADNKTISGTGTGSFIVKLSSLEKETTYYVRAYAINNEGISYGETITFTTNDIIYAGFSVSETKKVYFSQGNLQYQASTGIWRFAENQYDMVGEENSNISSSYSGWIDLFGWGTSGWKGGVKAYQPYSTSKSESAYYPGGSYSNDLTGSYTNADWGIYNKISNGGNQAGLWRTLTYNEWNYLIHDRSNASSKYGVATVNNVNGLVLLPDDWTLPNGVTFTSGAADPVYDDEGSHCNDSDYKTINNYSAEEWTKMEANGAVFLPAAGERWGSEVEVSGFYGHYWSSSASGYKENHAIGMTFKSCTVNMSNASGWQAMSVRLVRDVK